MIRYWSRSAGLLIEERRFILIFAPELVWLAVAGRQLSNSSLNLDGFAPFYFPKKPDFRAELCPPTMPPTGTSLSFATCYAWCIYLKKLLLIFLSSSRVASERTSDILFLLKTELDSDYPICHRNKKLAILLSTSFQSWLMKLTLSSDLHIFEKTSCIADITVGHNWFLHFAA